MFRIQAIVEGQGEELAVPTLIHRVASELFPEVQIVTPRPIRVARNKITRRDELEKYITIAADSTEHTDGILVLLDANGDCPMKLGPKLLAMAQAVRPDRLIRVTLAKREYESWFLASAESLRGHFGISATCTAPSNLEDIQNAKGWISKHMPNRSAYNPTAHQQDMTRKLDFTLARKSRSFVKLLRDIEYLLRTCQSRLG